MKTAYKIHWKNHSITRESVNNDWTEEYQQEHNNYLLWSTFDSARRELVKGLQEEVDELNSYTEKSYFIED